MAEATRQQEAERAKAEADARLAREVAELRTEAERRRTAELDEMRTQVSRLREAAAEHARSAAAAAVAAEVARARAVTAPAAQPRIAAGYVPPRPRTPLPRFILPLAASLVVLAVGGYTVFKVPGLRSMVLGDTAEVVVEPAPAPAPPAPAPATKKPARKRPAAAPAEPQTGDLSVTAPAGARVTLDGKPVGIAPLELQGIAAGTHTLELQSPSGRIRRSIVIRPGSRFIADEQIGPGYLSIVSRTPMEIFHGTRRLGSTEDDRVEMNAGVHLLTLVNPRTSGRTQMTVEIKPGEVSAYTIAPPTGRLVVNTVAGAEVFVEGESVGVAPLAELELPVGTRAILVRHPDLGEKRVTMEIKRDQTTEITLPLGSAPAEARRPAQPKLAPLSAQPAPRPR
jgi:hypothetical protein